MRLASLLAARRTFPGFARAGDPSNSFGRRGFFGARAQQHFAVESSADDPRPRRPATLAMRRWMEAANLPTAIEAPSEGRGARTTKSSKTYTPKKEPKEATWTT